jgi:hypothetical protein
LVRAVRRVQHTLEGLDPLPFEARKIHGRFGAAPIRTRRRRVNDLDALRRTGRDRHDRRVRIGAITGFDLMYVREIRGGLKTDIQLELPSEGAGVAVKPFYVSRRRVVSFDLVALSIERRAAIIVRSDVDIKNENVFAENVIKLLRDVASKIRMAAIGYFLGRSAQRAVNQFVCVSGAVRTKRYLCLEGAIQHETKREGTQDRMTNEEWPRKSAKKRKTESSGLLPDAQPEARRWCKCAQPGEPATWTPGRLSDIRSKHEPWFEGTDFGLWTLDSGLWTLDFGLWTLDSGLWTLDSGLWTLDSGLWTIPACIIRRVAVRNDK